MKETIQDKTFEDIHDVIKTASQILLLTFLAILIIYEFTPIYLGFYPLYLLIAVIIFGASELMIELKIRHTKIVRISTKYYIPCCVAGIMCAILTWHITMIFGILSYLISVFSGSLIMIFLILTFNGSSQEKSFTNA